MTIDTNLRSLRRLDSGFTMFNRSNEKAKHLCSHCARQTTCEVLDELQTVEEQIACDVVMRTCSLYITPLVFRNAAGLNCEEFNTIRLGKAWEDRLKPGDSCGFLTPQGSIIGVGTVKEVKTVSRRGLRKYAPHNHMLIQEKLGPTQALKRLMSIMRESYGPLWLDRAEFFSVITITTAGSD